MMLFLGQSWVEEAVRRQITSVLHVEAEQLTTEHKRPLIVSSRAAAAASKQQVQK
jgi:hypothetical protein